MSEETENINVSVFERLHDQNHAGICGDDNIQKIFCQDNSHKKMHFLSSSIISREEYKRGLKINLLRHNSISAFQPKLILTQQKSEQLLDTVSSAE